MLSTHGQQLYLTTTHYHPEHASGQGGFPKNTIVIRNRVQQAEADAEGARMIALFASRSPVMHSLLAGASVGPADMLFEHQAELDLGGVHARLLYFGPAHTRGDELIFVPEDSVLLPGDVVQNQISPNFTCDECTPASWLAVLDQVAALHPRIILPDHGGFGGEDLIAQESGFLTDLQNSAQTLERQGASAADAGRQIAAQFASRYAGWQNLRNVPHAVQLVYGERR
jgi:glyoxylase-like metal-dependent hydrolase (beta-lactamase superfamily II)